MSTRIGSREIGFDAIDVLRWIITVSFIAIIVTPVSYALSVSFRPQSEVYGPVHFIPYEFTTNNYDIFLSEATGFLLNSVLIATGASMLILLVAIPGAYAFARQEFPGKSKLFYAIIFIMLVPEVMIIIPVAQIIRWIELYDTIFGVWLGLMIGGMPIALWILRDNFEKLPPNAEEAAQVYGCTQFSAFIRVILPLATPAIVAVAFLAFLSAWTEFLFTNLLSTQQGAWPAIVYLFSLLSPDFPIDWPFTMAASFVIALPPIVFYALARRYLEKALDF